MIEAMVETLPKLPDQWAARSIINHLRGRRENPPEPSFERNLNPDTYRKVQKIMRGAMEPRPEIISPLINFVDTYFSTTDRSFNPDAPCVIQVLGTGNGIVESVIHKHLSRPNSSIDPRSIHWIVTDINQVCIDLAQELNGSVLPSAEHRVADATHIDFLENESVHLILSNMVLHHLEPKDVLKAMGEMVRVAKDGFFNLDPTRSLGGEIIPPLLVQLVRKNPEFAWVNRELVEAVQALARRSYVHAYKPSELRLAVKEYYKQHPEVKDLWDIRAEFKFPWFTGLWGKRITN